MAEIYGRSRAYAPRGHERSCRWITSDACLLDALTGNQLSIAGAMPIVCSAGTVTPLALELMRDAGIDAASERRPFDPQRTAVNVARDQAANGEKLVVQHVYPPDELPAEAFWIEPSLLRYLNNKANLVEFATIEQRPRRRVCRGCDLFRDGAMPPLPMVLKVATEDSTGGGAAVAVCRCAADVVAAAEKFKDTAGNLVVEEFLSISRNPCLHFAVMPNSTVRYLGHAEQDVTDAGRYCGNWIERGGTLPQHAIDLAMQAVRRAAMLGYRGIAGIDLALLTDGRVLVLDLNFRVNGSTAAVLFAPAVWREHSSIGIMHLKSFSIPAGDGFDRALPAVRSSVNKRAIIPLNIFDARAAGYPDRAGRLLALVLGQSKQQVLANEASLAADGLV
jgi:hypothetical protein